MEQLKIAFIDDGINTKYMDNNMKITLLEVKENDVIEVGNSDNELTHATKCYKVFEYYANNDNIHIVSIKILDVKTKKTNIENMKIALEWCLKNKIKIINMSLGSTLYSDYYAICSVVKKLYEKKVMIIAACNNYYKYTIPASMLQTIGVQCDKKGEIAMGKYLYQKNIFNIEIKVGSIEEKFPDLKIGNHNSYIAPFITAQVLNILLNNYNMSLQEVKKCLKRNADVLDDICDDDREDIGVEPVIVIIKDYFSTERVECLRQLLIEFIHNKYNALLITDIDLKNPFIYSLDINQIKDIIKFANADIIFIYMKNNLITREVLKLEYQEIYLFNNKKNVNELYTNILNLFS